MEKQVLNTKRYRIDEFMAVYDKSTQVKKHAELAKRLNISTSNLYKYRSRTYNDKDLKLEQVIIIADFFNVDLNEMINEPKTILKHQI